MSQPYPIPRSLWESLDAILYSKGIALARDIAAELGVQPNSLISSINIQERNKFTIIPDEDTATYQCPALIHHGSTYMRCRFPSLKPSPSFCATHERSSIDVDRTLPLVRRIVTPEETYMEKDNVVYSLQGTRIGILKGTVIKRFIIET